MAPAVDLVADPSVRGFVLLGFGPRAATSNVRRDIDMLVYFITDEPTKLPAIRAMLEPQYDVVPRLLGDGGVQTSARGVLMVDVDLRQMDRVEQLKLELHKLSGSPEKLFVVHNQVRSMVAQAYALGATFVISRPKEAVFKLAQIEEVEKAAQRDAVVPPPEMPNIGSMNVIG